MRPAASARSSGGKATSGLPQRVMRASSRSRSCSTRRTTSWATRPVVAQRQQRGALDGDQLAPHRAVLAQLAGGRPRAARRRRAPPRRPRSARGSARAGAAAAPRRRPPPRARRAGRAPPARPPAARSPRRARTGSRPAAQPPQQRRQRQPLAEQRDGDHAERQQQDLRALLHLDRHGERRRERDRAAHPRPADRDPLARVVADAARTGSPSTPSAPRSPWRRPPAPAARARRRRAPPRAAAPAGRAGRTAAPRARTSSRARTRCRTAACRHPSRDARSSRQ